MQKYLLGFVLLALFLSGCSGKKYFEPKKTDGYYSVPLKYLPSNISSFNKDGATLKENQFISKSGVSSYKIPKDFEFLNLNKETILASNQNNKLLLKNKTSKIIDMGNIVVAASVKNDIIAVVFIDNSIALYNQKLKKFTFKEYLQPSLANDTRIANPIFMDNIVLFPTLNGKIVVVGLKENKTIRSIVVDVNGQFNNIIFLGIVNEKLIAATANKIISVGGASAETKEYEIRDIISHKNKIYISTIDGQIISMDSNLNKLHSKKYKFAKIYALGFGSYLYALESQGFLIRLDEDFKEEKIFYLYFNEEENVIAIGNKLYYEDRYITLK